MSQNKLLPKSQKSDMLQALSLSELPEHLFMGVYYIQNKMSDKLYIGSSSNVFKRINSHVNLLVSGKHPNIHMQRSFTKYGIDAFAWGICEEVKDVDVLLDVEQNWIDAVGDYNICKEAGSTRGVKPSEETRLKWSVARSGKGNPMFGVKRPDVGEMMRKLHTGKKLTEQHKQKCSDALKGKRGPWANPETAERLRAMLKDLNVGRKHTDETKLRLSAAGRGRVRSPESIEKTRLSNLGRKHTEETKARLSAVKMGKKLNLSDEERERRAQAAASIRSKMTEEQKAAVAKKRADACRGKPLSDDLKKRLSLATKGRALSETHLANLRAAAANRKPLTDEQRKAKSDAIKKAKASRTPEQIAEWKSKLSKAKTGKPRGRPESKTPA